MPVSVVDYYSCPKWVLKLMLQLNILRNLKSELQNSYSYNIEVFYDDDDDDDDDYNNYWILCLRQQWYYWYYEGRPIITKLHYKMASFC